MTDETLKSAVEYFNNWDNTEYIKTVYNTRQYLANLVSLAEQYLAISKILPKKGELKKPREGQCAEMLELIKDENIYIEERNITIEECRLAFIKKLEGLERVINNALEAPLPEDDTTTAEEIAIAIHKYILE